MYRIKENKKYIKLFLKQCRQNLEHINKAKDDKKEVKTVFTIGSTKNYKNILFPYPTPPRFNKHFYITGCVVFTQTQAIAVALAIDSLVDIIAVDAEKKLPMLAVPDFSLLPNNIIMRLRNEQKTVELTEAGNLTAACSNFIKKSKFYEFKANDLTVDAAWAFVSNKMKVLSGKKIAIIGAGNIGTKLALKFVECGVNVNINRRNEYKGYTIANAINLIKPQFTISTVSYIEDILKSCFLADVILGCTDGNPAIEWEHICASKKDSLIIDVGKGSISKEAIKKALEFGKPIYRTDVSAALDAHLNMLIRNDEIIGHSLERKKIGGLVFVSGGMYGQKGDFVVDNVNEPRFIFGIANGEGDMIRNLTQKQKNIISKLNKIIQD